MQERADVAVPDVLRRAGVVFEVERRRDYPRLGWLLELRRRSKAYCGEGVEVFEHGLVEGCWDGPFTEFGFPGRTNLFGSGAVLRGGGWWFCPPCHTLDALYALVHRGQTFVANSLAILFRHAGLSPDLNVSYTARLGTVVAGLDGAETVIWRNEDTVLYRIVGDEFGFVDGSLLKRRRVETASFSDFTGYHRHLLRTLAACRDNASDPARSRSYRLVSTCSGGYDSNVAAALAAALGGDRAITLRSARGGVPDSGRAVAESLGLRCVEHDRREAGAGGGEVEFLTTGTGGGDYPLGSFRGELDGALLLTGYHGDKVWERTVPPNVVLKRGDSSGCSLGDFRLRTGFLHIPVPFIGALRHPAIHAISNAPEMRAFSVGGSYDRPICRRILEEAGVPRELVGRSKRAVTTPFTWSPRYLSPEVRAAFEGFLQEKGMLGRTRLELGLFQAATMGFRGLRKATKMMPLLEWPLGSARDRLEPRFRALENSRYANLLFIWALEHGGAGTAPAQPALATGPRLRAGATAQPLPG